MQALLLAVALLAPLLPGATPAAPSEFEILDGYLAQYDGPEVQGDHCRRSGGPPVGLPVDVEVPIASWRATNSMMTEHREWHADHSDVDDDPADNVTYGIDFVLFHREMLAHYDTWRVENGYRAVEPWDPSTPIPAAFAYAPVGCHPRLSEDPQVMLPSWATVEGGDTPSRIWGYKSLCEFPTLNRVAKALDDGELGNGSYHGSVHGRVGGDMGPPAYAPRDPIFYAWHKYLDGLFVSWERSCDRSAAAGVGAATVDGKSVPAAAASGTLLGLAAAAAVLATRARRG